jgi:uncharacterized membrane protein YeaQ/YmgE (transglycosylase-associated protein family)
MFFVVLLSWVAAGLVVGFIASKAVNLRGDDPRLGIGSAVAGALLVAAIFSMVRGYPMTVWALGPFVAAAIGGVVAVIVWHAIRSRSISHDRYVPRQSN